MLKLKLIMSRECLELDVIHVFQSNRIMNSLISLSTVLILNSESAYVLYDFFLFFPLSCYTVYIYLYE